MPDSSSPIANETTAHPFEQLAGGRRRLHKVHQGRAAALLLVVLLSDAMAQAQDWWLYHRQQGCVRPPLVEGERFLPEVVIKHFPKCFIDSSDTYGKGPWTFVNCFDEQRVGSGFFYFRQQHDCRAFAARADEIIRQKR